MSKGTIATILVLLAVFCPLDSIVALFLIVAEFVGMAIYCKLKYH